MVETTPDSCEIFENNLVDTYYPQRPDELEECCLYDFKKYYKFNGIDSNGRRSYQRLNKPILPNHRIFDPNKEDQREDYYYSLLLLFVPFRNESNLVESFNSAEEAFNHFITSSGDMHKHHESLQKMLNAQSTVHKINEYRAENEVSAKDNANEQEGLDIPGVAAAAMDDVRECDAAQDMGIQERINMLSNDQRRIFNNLNDHLMHQYKHEHGECNCNALKPIHMFISGVGGTGKSFLIETFDHRSIRFGKAMSITVKLYALLQLPQVWLLTILAV